MRPEPGDRGPVRIRPAAGKLRAQLRQLGLENDRRRRRQLPRLPQPRCDRLARPRGDYKRRSHHNRRQPISDYRDTKQA